MQSSFFDLQLVYGTPLLLIVCACTFVSQLPKRYETWKKNRTGKDFSAVLFIVTITFLFGFYSLGALAILAEQSLHSASTLTKCVISISTVLLLYHAVVPYAHQNFENFKQTKKHSHFYSFIALSMIFAFFFLYLFVGLIKMLAMLCNY